MATPDFVEDHSLNIGLMCNLIEGGMSMVGLGGVHTCPLGYIIIRVQVDGEEGYNEDQIAFVIPYLFTFA